MSSRPAAAPRPSLADRLPRLRGRLPVPRLPLLPSLAVVTAVLVLIGGWLMFRDSPLVQVKEVSLTGAKGPQAAAIRAAAEDAARSMTTLHVDEAALLDALAAYPVVRAVHADGDFPHRLRIQIVQYAPVGTVDVGGKPVPIASDGTVLRGASTTGLAALPAKSAPRTGHVTDPRTVRAVRLLAAAPSALRDHVARVLTGPRGLTVRLERGPALIFGNVSRTPAKWAAAVAVLADPSSAGATSIDLRVPERPTAAGLEQIAEQQAADGGAAVTTTPAQDGTTPAP